MERSKTTRVKGNRWSHGNDREDWSIKRNSIEFSNEDQGLLKVSPERDMLWFYEQGKLIFWFNVLLRFSFELTRMPMFNIVWTYSSRPYFIFIVSYLRKGFVVEVWFEIMKEIEKF